MPQASGTAPPAKHSEQDMKTRPLTTDHSQRDQQQYALCRRLGFWEVTFEGRHATFQHESGAPYVARLLLHPPPKPIHALALALDARTLFRPTPTAAEVIQQRLLGLEEAGTVRSLRRRERELEAVLDDDEEKEPLKAEALGELEAIYDFMRKHPWRSRDCVQKCARVVGLSIRCLHARLAAAVDAEGKPDPVLRAFARHLNEHLLIPSDGGGIQGRFRVGAALPGWFTYEPPPGVVWEGRRMNAECRMKEEIRRPASLGSQGQDAESPRLEVRKPKTEARRPISEDGRRRTEDRGAAAVGYLSRFLCVGFALALAVTGCVGPRPLKGGRAVTTHKPAGGIEQTLVQGENPSQATKQDQETVKVRNYTVPAGSRMEQSSATAFHDSQYERNDLLSPSLSSSKGERGLKAGEGARQPSTSLLISAPMPVVEREETRSRTELGAAQKDTARELGAKLASLKGIVWVGVGLFVFGLASLVWPPLKVIVGSVTTSAALMLGGVVLMVLPSMVVGNELLILGVVGIAVGGWFLAHRHGQLRGQVAASVKREA